MPNVESVAGDIASAPGSARYRRRGPVKRTVLYPHGPGVKWPRLYRKFRRKGWTKSKAARVSNEMYNKIRRWQASGVSHVLRFPVLVVSTPVVTRKHLHEELRQTWHVTEESIPRPLVVVLASETRAA